MRKLILITIALCLAAFAVPAFAGVVADSQNDFQAIRNADGSGTGQGVNGWYYMYVNTVAAASDPANMVQDATVCNWQGEPYWYASLDDNWYASVGKTFMRAQTYWTRCPVRRWVSTVNNTITITGSVSKSVETNSSKQFLINVNGVNKDTEFIDFYDNDPHPFSITVPVQVGDKIDFIWDAASTGLEGSNDAITANMTATITIPGATLGVNVTLEDYNGDFDLVPIKVALTPSGGGTAITKTVTPTGPNTTVTFTDVNPGTYTVQAKAAKFVTQSTTTTVGTAGTSLSLSLPNGDVDGDGTVTSTDVSTVVKNLDKTGN